MMLVDPQRRVCPRCAGAGMIETTKTPRAGKAQIVTVPEWLAKAKGLV